METNTHLLQSRKFFYLIISLALLSLPVSETHAQKNAKNIDNRLTAIIDSFYVTDSLPGITVAIWTPDYTYKHAVGKADIISGRERKVDDFIRIGSITKTFVATVILQLVDEGKIALDDPLSKYFPAYPNSQNITIRQMLDMTSGIPDYIGDPGVLNSFISDRTKQYSKQEIFDITASMTPSFEPGSGWNYSNGSYHLLGMLIEKITANDLGTEINSRIIKPLNLTSTSFPTSSVMPEIFSHGYMRDTVTGVLIDCTTFDPSVTWAAGCMISTLPDLKTYVQALVDGTLISAKSQDERLKFHKVNKFEYVLGIFSIDGFLGHNGGITGFNTTMCYNPELKTTIIVSVNKYDESGGKSDPLFMELAKAVFPDKNLFAK